MGCFKNIYENNHVPKTGSLKCAVVEDAANSIFYLYDDCGSYAIIKSVNGDFSELEARVAQIEARLDAAGIPPTDNMTNIQGWLENTFLETVGDNGTEQNYRVINESEFEEVIFGLRLVSQEMGQKYSDIDISDAAAMLTPHGFTVEKGVDDANATPYVLVYNENTRNTANRRAWGVYYFNMASKASLLVTAPHPKSDSFSESMALRHAQKQPGAILMMSGVYRTTFDGMKITLSTNATSGDIQLGFRGDITAPIPYNVMRADLEAALEALPSIGVGNVKVYNENSMTSINRLIVQLDPSLYNSGSPSDTVTLSSSTMDAPLNIVNWTDEARNYNSLFHRAVGEFNRQGMLTLQYHGFSNIRNTGVPRAANVVISDARSPRTPVYYAARDALDRNGIQVLTRYDYNTQGISFLGDPSTGSFTLGYDGETTAAIPYTTSQNTLAGLMEDALEDLSNIGEGNVKVELSTNDNQGIPTFVVRFVGKLYREAVGPRIVATSSLNQGSIAVVNGSNVGLAAVTNGQARAAQEEGYTFIHLEVSSTYRFNETLRNKFVDVMDGVNFPKLAAASFPAAARPGDRPSNAPVAVGRGLRTGRSKVWSPSDHVHPWSNSDFDAGDNYIAGRNSNNSGNVWRTPTQLAGLLGLGGIWLPSDYNLMSWTYDPVVAAEGTSQVTADGEAQVVRLRIPTFLVAGDIENIHAHVSFPGVDVLGFYVALYQDGVLLGQSADLTAMISTVGYKTLPLQAPVDVSQGIVEVVFWVESSTTPPSFRSTGDSAIVNGPFNTSGSRYATADTGLTTTAPPTLGAKTALARSYWIGLS